MPAIPTIVPLSQFRCLRIHGSGLPAAVVLPQLQCFCIRDLELAGGGEDHGSPFFPAARSVWRNPLVAVADTARNPEVTGRICGGRVVGVHVTSPKPLNRLLVSHTTLLLTQHEKQRAANNERRAQYRPT